MNIIYVDDDATNRTVLQHMLATAGLPMAEAADARTGLQMIADGAYDVVIMDLRMPEVSGLTAIRQLRARERGGSAVPIVVVSAELSKGVRELCHQAGADGFIEKPVTMDVLFTVVGAAIAKREQAVLN